MPSNAKILCPKKIAYSDIPGINNPGEHSVVGKVKAKYKTIAMLVSKVQFAIIDKYDKHFNVLIKHVIHIGITTRAIIE